MRVFAIHPVLVRRVPPNVRRGPVRDDHDPAPYTPHGRLLGFVQLVDVGEEQNLQSYVSALNLPLAAILLLVLWRITATEERPFRSY